MVEERMTLVERLRCPAYLVNPNDWSSPPPRLDFDKALADMKEAADEIERLQRLVGVGSLKPPIS
jgi:hypothetical protein